MEKKEKVAPWFYFVWSTPLIGLALATCLASYITYFATNVLGLNPILVGTLLLISKIFDGFTDLVAGFIIDHTNTRIGRGRPYDLSYALYCLFIMLIFVVPSGSSTQSAVVVFILYTIAFSIFQTLYSSASIVYLSRAVEGENAQISVNMFSGVIAAIAGAIVGIGFPQIIKQVGTAPEAWRQMALISSIPAILISSVRFFVVKEKKKLTSEQATSIKLTEGIKLLAHNRYILVFGLALLINNIVTNLAAAHTYYFQYIVGDIGKMSFYTMGALFSMLTIAFYPSLTKRFGMKKLIMFGLGAGAVGRMLPLLAPANLGILIISSILVNFASMPISMLATNVTISCMDYGEYEFGVRGEGIYTCVIGFCSKVGIGLGSLVIGIITGLGGFDGMAAIQTPRAMNSILMLFTVIPAVGFLISMFVMHFYKLDELAPKITKELAARREAKEAK